MLLESIIENIDYMAISLNTSNLNDVDVRTIIDEIRRKKPIKIGINLY